MSPQKPSFAPDLPAATIIAFIAFLGNSTGAGIDLGSFTLETEPVELAQVVDDGSGLTLSSLSSTLFSVRNNGPPALFEFDTSGALLREIGLTGFEDPEGITHLGGRNFALVEERRNTLVTFTVNDGAPLSIDRSDGTVYDIHGAAIGSGGVNDGPEGIAYDAASGIFYVAKEKNSPGLYAYSASGGTLTLEETFDLSVPAFAGISDFAGLDFLPNGNLLLVSDESQSLVELDISDPAAVVKVGELDLSDVIAVPSDFQPEGVSYDPVTGALFVISEPDFLYVLTPPGGSAGAPISIPEPARVGLAVLGLLGAISSRRRPDSPRLP